MACRALEDVCSGRIRRDFPVYHLEFADHVNARVPRPRGGPVTRSLSIESSFPDLRFVVEDQVSPRLTGRLTLDPPRHPPRPPRAAPRIMTVASRTAGIIEDHAASDTMEPVRQLGAWRSLLLAVKHRRLIFRRT